MNKWHFDSKKKKKSNELVIQIKVLFENWTPVLIGSNFVLDF